MKTHILYEKHMQREERPITSSRLDMKEGCFLSWKWISQPYSSGPGIANES